jgi:hypothetical protein
MTGFGIAAVVGEGGRMRTLIMLTRPAPAPPGDSEAVERIRADCPDIQWIGRYAVPGSPDRIDIFRTPDSAVAERISAILGSCAFVHSEIWATAEWDGFKHIIGGLDAIEIAGASPA